MTTTFHRHFRDVPEGSWRCGCAAPTPDQAYFNQPMPEAVAA